MNELSDKSQLLTPKNQLSIQATKDSSNHRLLRLSRAIRLYDIGVYECYPGSFGPQ